MFMKTEEIDVYQFLWGRRIGKMKFETLFFWLLHCFKQCMFRYIEVSQLDYLTL